MLAFVVGGILVCTMFFLVISVFFYYGLLAVSGGYYCGHSLLTFANFRSVKRSCGSTMFISCFTGVLSRLHCHVLRVIYTGHVFPYFRRYLCSPSRNFLHVFLVAKILLKEIYYFKLAYFVAVGSSVSSLTFVGVSLSVLFYVL